MFFFFQAEDGIRDRNVTGVQTCALPIWICSRPIMARGPAVERAIIGREQILGERQMRGHALQLAPEAPAHAFRSEERRVGKECSSRMSPGYLTTNILI